MATTSPATASPSQPDPGGYVYRDRDPPPPWNGERPEATLKQYLKDLQLWEAVTDLPLTKRGPKLVQALTGPGVKTVTKALTAAFEPYQETALPRAMEAALFGNARTHKETIPQYLLRFQNAQRALRDEGVELPSKAKGYLLYRQSNLDKDLDARLLTWLAGDYSEDVVMANLRRLDRAIQEGGRKPSVYYEDHFEDETGGGEDDWPEPETYYEDYAEDYADHMHHHSAHQKIYYQDPVTDEAFQEIVEEDELLEVLASYQDVRDSLRMARNGRGYYPKACKGILWTDAGCQRQAEGACET